MNNNTSKKAGMIGTVNPTMDVKVGDLIQVRAIEGRSKKVVAADAVIVEDHGAIVEVLVTHTIKVESVDEIGGNLWCKGPIVETDGGTPLGRVMPAYLGAL
ncbi:hypothetical protein PBI_COLTRANE_32 [Microbacterium phage Coltrane]|uniref:Uncharacterized protein n=6 Tax=Armstrongvirus armstrong TaxID=2734217 RepID=A0A3G2KD56_9CAUD|nr:hypothetical protein HOU45_gp32 [Microbacterium phage Armstrong]AYN55903.1 hypothetical protein PBI_BRAHMS_32 [Microbacterium phage Brahms]AYN57009.1 hypothetical protein PBI_BERNSTEIN_32 [Microbacterium phage Bernstein]AYN57368.1 hypothetical protein PBI_COLTRANE_32 [Microbacterium phage Coltrane]AYN58956.1 hypothetical protein PBI_ROLLINS_32 [Microbacterium phage Rollins]QED11455.1 hypothetical protein SEA_VITAS_32 [Microbacterium phage Vitas]UGL61999.1 hypothetical protein SEA_SKYLORD_3